MNQPERFGGNILKPNDLLASAKNKFTTSEGKNMDLVGEQKEIAEIIQANLHRESPETIVKILAIASEIPTQKSIPSIRRLLSSATFRTDLQVTPNPDLLQAHIFEKVQDHLIYFLEEVLELGLKTLSANNLFQNRLYELLLEPFYTTYQTKNNDGTVKKEFPSIWDALIDVEPERLQKISYLILKLATAAEEMVEGWPNTKVSKDRKSRKYIVGIPGRIFIDRYENGYKGKILNKILTHSDIRTLLNDTKSIFAEKNLPTGRLKNYF